MPYILAGNLQFVVVASPIPVNSEVRGHAFAIGSSALRRQYTISGGA